MLFYRFLGHHLEERRLSWCCRWEMMDLWCFLLLFYYHWYGYLTISVTTREVDQVVIVVRLFICMILVCIFVSKLDWHVRYSLLYSYYIFPYFVRYLFRYWLNLLLFRCCFYWNWYQYSLVKCIWWIFFPTEVHLVSYW